MKKLFLSIAVLMLLVGCGKGKIDTPEKCLTHLKGVWTFTEPLSGGYKTEPYWVRFEFTDTGVIKQTARPSDTNWSVIEKFGYSVKMEKTADSGEWYCRAKIDDTVLNIAVEKDGKTTLFRPLNPDMMDLPLTKKDKRLGA